MKKIVIVSFSRFQQVRKIAKGCLYKTVSVDFSVAVVTLAVLVNNANGQIQYWSLHSAVSNLVVGPATAVYCKLKDPSNKVTFDGFGPCMVNVDCVTEAHDGLWTMSTILPNNVLAAESGFMATVDALGVSGPRLTVTTSVETEKPLVKLACSIMTTEAITTCVFRNPTGKVLQARQGVSEDHYSFLEGSTAGVQSCGIEINSPENSDLGLWRCDVQTASDIYYGHLSVLCPWAMSVPEIAEAVVSVPTLKSTTKDQFVPERESVTMTCSIQSSLRYCYFRSRNGTIFNVRPGMTSSSVEYVGVGLEAGECGVRFSSLFASDSGAWSCHVGLTDPTEPEQRVSFNIQVQEELSVSQYMDGDRLVVEGIVYGGPALDYCRFVRIDGLGFTSNHIPSDGYTDGSTLSHGHCKLRIIAPTILEQHPWLVVAKVTGQDDELSRTTKHNIDLPGDVPGGTSAWWICVMVATLAVVSLLTTFAFRRNRRWAAANTAGCCDNFRKTNQSDPEKPPLPA